MAQSSIIAKRQTIYFVFFSEFAAYYSIIINVEKQHQQGTVRIEAFSDGIFCVAITLLGIEIGVPPHDTKFCYVGLLACFCLIARDKVKV